MESGPIITSVAEAESSATGAPKPGLTKGALFQLSLDSCIGNKVNHRQKLGKSEASSKSVTMLV